MADVINVGGGSGSGMFSDISKAVVPLAVLGILGYAVYKAAPNFLQGIKGDGSLFNFNWGLPDNVAFAPTTGETSMKPLIDDYTKPLIGAQGQRADGSYIIGGNNWTNLWSQPALDWIKSNGLDNVSPVGQALLDASNYSPQTGWINPTGLAQNLAEADALKAAASGGSATGSSGSSGTSSSKSSGGSGTGSAWISSGGNTPNAGTPYTGASSGSGASIGGRNDFSGFYGK